MLDKFFDSEKVYVDPGLKVNTTIAGLNNLAEIAGPKVETREVNGVETTELGANDSMQLHGVGWVLTAYLPKGHSTSRGMYVNDAAAFEAQMGVALTDIEGVKAA